MYLFVLSQISMYLFVCNMYISYILYILHTKKYVYIYIFIYNIVIGYNYACISLPASFPFLSSKLHFLGERFGTLAVT